MLAIPVFRARVAPVLDWCSKIIIVSEEGLNAASGRQIDVTKENIFGMMQTLLEQGIKTLICGALSHETLDHGESIGLKIIHGIAGDIEEVLQAYRDQKLNQPKYWLPGCRAQCRYKSNTTCAKSIDEKKEGRASGSKAKGPAGGGRGAGRPEGLCICPECGIRARHEKGIHCPACGSLMIRA